MSGWSHALGDTHYWRKVEFAEADSRPLIFEVYGPKPLPASEVSPNDAYSQFMSDPSLPTLSEWQQATSSLIRQTWLRSPQVAEFPSELRGHMAYGSAVLNIDHDLAKAIVRLYVHLDWLGVQIPSVEDASQGSALDALRDLPFVAYIGPVDLTVDDWSLRLGAIVKACEQYGLVELGTLTVPEMTTTLFVPGSFGDSGIRGMPFRPNPGQSWGQLKQWDLKDST